MTGSLMLDRRQLFRTGAGVGALALAPARVGPDPDEENRRLAVPRKTIDRSAGRARRQAAVHVNRSIKALRETGSADIRKGKLIVKDWQELQAVGEFDPTYLHLKTLPRAA
jgi:hypothetical protein